MKPLSLFEGAVSVHGKHGEVFYVFCRRCPIYLSVKGKMIFCRLDPLWSRGCPNPRVESNDVKLIFIFVLFNKYYCVISKNFVTYSTATQIYISATCKTAMTTSGKISKNIQFQNTHAALFYYLFCAFPTS